MDSTDVNYKTAIVAPTKQAPKLLILRGAPGSGKTTIAQRCFAKWVHASADDHFINKKGVYVFDPTKLQDAHDECYDKTVDAIKKGQNVIVDNTNRRIDEFRRYLRIPGCEIKIYRVITSFGSTKEIPQRIMDLHRREYEAHKEEIHVQLVINPEDDTHTLQFRKPNK